MKAHFTKLFVAVALFVAVTGSGIVAEFAGFDVVPSVSAGNCGNSGGNC